MQQLNTCNFLFRLKVFEYIMCNVRLSNAEFNVFSHSNGYYYFPWKIYEAINTFNGITVQGECCSSSFDSHTFYFAGITD